MGLVLAGELHHDPALDTGQFWYAVPALVLLVVVTAWAWRRGQGRWAALAVVAACGLWLLADPVHEPSLWTFMESHAVTPGDLLVLPALAVAVVVLRRGLGDPEPVRH
ncbi:hypothetical protein [Oryzihumus sp.]|uniref:hypothetical protein n=1 Tax=Oryzihumus sp. TaxID=1968903 RepID=UPI002ED886D9